MSKLVGILGLGIFGSTIAKTLSEFDSDVIAVDKDPENVNRLEPFITKGIIGDVTDLALLESIGLSDCDVVVIATGTVLEASVLAVMNCKKLGIKHIIAKARAKQRQSRPARLRQAVGYLVCINDIRPFPHERSGNV